MEVIEKLRKDGIFKIIRHPGVGNDPNYPDGTKITFHYRTCKCDDDNTVVDDSKKFPKPMELILGKKFKLEVWEECLKTMKSKEVSEFTCERSHVAAYPLVSKSLRDIFLGKDKHGHHEEHHCCGMMALKEHGLGAPELDELMKNPQPLAFTFEILKVELPGDFEKESWTLTPDEKLVLVPKLKEDGNEMFKQKKYAEASDKYALAITYLDNLALNEKPGTEEHDKFEDMKIPLLLNYSQCKLFENDFYPVLEHTNTVLKRDPDNVKALFRRAKAHSGVWDVEEARADFRRVLELDPTLEGTVKKELRLLEERVKQKTQQEKASLQGMFG